jgi:hypothetical protein
VPALPAARSHHATLGQQFEVDRAPFIIVEAIIKRVAEAVQAEVPRTPRVGAIQKRTMVALISHIHIGRMDITAMDQYRPAPQSHVN